MLLKSRAQGHCMLAKVIRSWLSSWGAIFHKSPIASVRGGLHVQVGSVRANWPYLVRLWNQLCNHWLVSTCNARTLRKGLTAEMNEGVARTLWNRGYVGVAIYFLDSNLRAFQTFNWFGWPGMNASRTIPFREGGTCKCLKLNVQDPPSLNDVHTNLSRRSASSLLWFRTVLKISFIQNN